jgi:large subunit ribosomal protein L35
MLGPVREGEMPKMKTHKTSAKRFRITASGRIRRTKIGKSHLRRKKPARVVRSFDKLLEVDDQGSVKRVKRLIPYLAKRS